MIRLNIDENYGQWLWLSWESGHFLHQRSVVQIQPTKILYRTFDYCQLHWKYENKEKEARSDPFININVNL